MSEYEADILLWSENQAELLRRRAAGAFMKTEATTAAQGSTDVILPRLG